MARDTPLLNSFSPFLRNSHRSCSARPVCKAVANCCSGTPAALSSGVNRILKFWPMISVAGYP
jgi:hypothetical protein